MTPRSLTPKAEVTPPGGNDSRTTVPNVVDASATKQTGDDEASFSEYGRVSERAECGGGVPVTRYLPRRIFKGGEGEFETKMSKQFPDRRWRAALQEEWWKREGRKSVARLCEIRRGKSTHS